MKTNDYLCPFCKGHLNVGNKVVFSSKNSRKKKGLILLSPEIGGYSYEHHPNYEFKKGETVQFNCPVCQHDLSSDKNPKFASVLMIDHNDMQYDVLFSRVAGEQSTYVVSNDQIEEFGNDALRFDDMF